MKILPPADGSVGFGSRLRTQAHVLRGSNVAGEETEQGGWTQRRARLAELAHTRSVGDSERPPSACDWRGRL